MPVRKKAAGDTIRSKISFKMTQKMPEQDPGKRIHNFDEVNMGYTPEQAIAEASRCLQCQAPKCVDGCPVNINIPKFIGYIKEGKVERAIKTIKKTNNLPGVCGRVCPQEEQCEKSCILNAKNAPINIGYLERFASDSEGELEIKKVQSDGKKVAVVGSGPAGLTCAADLALMGHKVTVFEALHKPGGVLVYGIPEFRLPNNVVEREIDFIQQLGVALKTNVLIGKTMSLEDIDSRFDAVFIGTGAGLPNFMRIPGENLVGVYSANEFLTRSNLMHAYKFPEYATPIKKAQKTVVVGGGNVAMDSARTARRLGADVTIVYRRSISEMPARKEEIKHAQEEGIKFMMLTSPTRILGEEKVAGIECVQMMLGEPDESDRRTPIPIENTEFVIGCDQVIIAIGQNPNPLIARLTNLQHGPKNNLIVNDKFQTSNPKIFAAGDIVSGAATVIKAMGDAKKAAKAIDEFLKNEPDQSNSEAEIPED